MPRFNPDDYIDVQERIVRFWQDHPDGQIITDLMSDPTDFAACRYKASVWKERGHLDSKRPDATGWAFELAGGSGANSTSHEENCETSAIGRALANLGYATSREDRPSRQEMQKVDRMQASTQRPVYPTGTGSFKTIGDALTPEMRERIAQAGPPEPGETLGPARRPLSRDEQAEWDQKQASNRSVRELHEETNRINPDIPPHNGFSFKQWKFFVDSLQKSQRTLFDVTEQMADSFGLLTFAWGGINSKMLSDTIEWLQKGRGNLRPWLITEKGRTLPEPPQRATAASAPIDTSLVRTIVETFLELIADAPDEETLRALWEKADAEGLLTGEHRQALTAAVVEAEDRLGLFGG